MADESGKTKCKCSSHPATGAQSQPQADVIAKMVQAQVPQGYDAKFNVRIVPAHSLDAALHQEPHCTRRGNAPQGWIAGTLGIGQGVLTTLGKADKTVVDWLAKDPANAQRFLASPVTAMREAGVQFSRMEEKLLARAVVAATDARPVAPGVNVTAVLATAYPDGRVGGIGSNPGGGKDEFGCGPRKK